MHLSRFTTRALVFLSVVMAPTGQALPHRGATHCLQVSPTSRKFPIWPSALA